MVLGNRIRIGPSAPDGGVAVEISGSDEQAIAGHIAGFGGMLEVHEPAAVREHLAAIASELDTLYRS